MKISMGVNGVPDKDRKSCFDCTHCQCSFTWWCVKEEAVQERGTKVPGGVHCPYWEGIITKEELYKNAPFLSKLLGTYRRGYLEIDLSENKRPLRDN